MEEEFHFTEDDTAFQMSIRMYVSVNCQQLPGQDPGKVF